MTEVPTGNFPVRRGRRSSVTWMNRQHARRGTSSRDRAAALPDSQFSFDLQMTKTQSYTPCSFFVDTSHFSFTHLYMEPIEKVLKAVLDAHAGDEQLLAVQLKASPVSVQRWMSGTAKPRPAYEAKLRRIYSEFESQTSVLREDPPRYRVTPHHPMITEAVDATLKSIREILHKRAHLSSRSQALDELSKLLFAHVDGMRSGRGGISRQTVAGNGRGLAAALKTFVDDKIHVSLPESLAHTVDVRDFELRLKPQEDELAAELIECFESLQRQTSSFNFSGFDILNEVFGKFLADSFVDEKELGQYLTPPEVVRFMVGLAIHGLSASELETICDPKTLCGIRLGSRPVMRRRFVHRRIRASTWGASGRARAAGGMVESHARPCCRRHRQERANGAARVD